MWLDSMLRTHNLYKKQMTEAIRELESRKRADIEGYRGDSKGSERWWEAHDPVP